MSEPAVSSVTAGSGSGHACPNCGRAGAGKFCQECGQILDTHRVTVSHLLHEVFHFFTHVEKGLLYTLKDLLLRPGYMERDYLAGRRVRYQQPFSSFLLACTVTALGQYAIRLLVLRWYGIADDQEDFFRHYFSLVQLVLLPLYAGISWAFFRRGRYNYAEIMVVVLYSLSLLIYGTLLLNALRLIWPHFDSKYVELPLIVVYNTVTYLRLFPGDSKGLTVAKSLLLNCACFALAQAAQVAAVRLMH